MEGFESLRMNGTTVSARVGIMGHKMRLMQFKNSSQ